MVRASGLFIVPIIERVPGASVTGVVGHDLFSQKVETGCKVLFYVNHQALLYLVNKAVLSGRICIWFLLLKDFDSSIVTRPVRSHVAAYHLSRLRNGEGPEGVPAPRRFFLP